MGYGGLLRHLRWRLFRNHFDTLLKQSPIRVLTILLCSALVWGSLFILSRLGFRELETRWDLPLDERMIVVLFDVMFFALAFLLIFSSGIILFASLFSTTESWYLLSTPIPADHVFAYKFQGAIAFSSWAFILLGSPILLAYGLEVGDGAPGIYFLTLPLFVVGFVLLPGSIGALLVLVLVNVVPRRRKQVFWMLGVFALVALLLLGVLVLRGARPYGFGSRDWFESLLGDLALLGTRLVPLHWMSHGLRAAARGETANTLYHLALVWSNGLMLYLATVWTARRLYRRGFERLASGTDMRRRYGGAWLDAIVERLLFFLDRQTRLLVVKDFRTFRRDPAQWFQLAIFLGLVLLYFSNLRRFYSQQLAIPFRNGISLLTLAATAFLLCAYTGRFIFPMLSLEGRKFWILGLLPLEREKLLLGKFAFSALWCVLSGALVVLLSDLLLGMPAAVVLVHQAAVFVVGIGLSGLSVGLGAVMPNFRESDPSKIAVGFGGTLNLVAGLLYLLLVILLTCGPFHLVLAWSGGHGSVWQDLPWWGWASLCLGLAVGFAGAWLPLRAGERNLRSMEF